jgi:cobaltochelatase CobS
MSNTNPCNTAISSVISHNEEVKYHSVSELTTSPNYKDGGDYIFVNAREHFGINELDENLIVPIFKRVSIYRAGLNTNYVPDPSILEKVLKILISPDINAGLCLKGESGSGKTELALYVSHMLNWPITIKQINSNIRADELEGERSLVDGNTGFTQSDLVKAFQNGHIILLDEIDKFDPDTSARLHMPLERKAWSLGSNGGEVVHPHRHTRFLGTANTNMGGEDMRFVSSQRQDSAFIKRFLQIQMPAPDEVGLMKVLNQHFPEIKNAVLKHFADVCMAINKCGHDDMHMDKRELIAWLSTSDVLSNISILETFDIAFGASLSVSLRNIALEAIDLKLADTKTMTFEELTSKK